MKTMLKNMGLISIMILISACGATPPVREVTLPEQKLGVESADRAHSKLVLFNDSNRVMYGMDGSGKINIHLDGKGAGQLRIGEYLILDVTKGAHKIDLLHVDMMTFKSSHDIEVKNDEEYAKVYAKMTSNGIEIVEKPADFESKFKPTY